MRLLIILLSLISASFADPSWITSPQGEKDKPRAVGIAEVFFPSHVQERVALVRARAKLRQKLKDGKNKNAHGGTSSVSVKSKENLGLEIIDKFIDADGNLYLLVSFP